MSSLTPGKLSYGGERCARTHGVIQSAAYMLLPTARQPRVICRPSVNNVPVGVPYYFQSYSAAFFKKFECIASVF